MTHTFNTPIGAVRLTEEGGSIIRIELTDAAGTFSAPTPLLREAEHQITAFLRGERRQLDFPIRMVGTPFQQRVWQALQQIPYGATRTYGAIATAIGNPRASRPWAWPATRIPCCSSSPAIALSEPMVNLLVLPMALRPSDGCWSWKNQYCRYKKR